MLFDKASCCGLISFQKEVISGSFFGLDAEVADVSGCVSLLLEDISDCIQLSHNRLTWSRNLK